MEQNNTAQKKFNQLRRQAEKLLTTSGYTSPASGSEDPLKLIHELQTFQIELELQNEELRRSQERLMQFQTKYSDLYDFAPVGYVSLSLKGLILNINLTLADYLSRERRSLIGQPLTSIIVSEDQDIFYRHLLNLSNSKTHEVCELRLTKEGAPPFDAQLESTIVSDESQETWQYHTVVINITNRNRTKQILVQSEKMMSVGGLAVGMAHEINNPLAGMIQNANVMHNRLTRQDLRSNRKAAEKAGVSMESIKTYMEDRGILGMIEHINASGKRIKKIVNNMLGFARKGDAVFSFHTLSKIIDKTLELAAIDFDEKKHYDFKKIKIKKEYHTKVPKVPCDGAKIQQVLLNIFRNGSQAMHGAGTKNPGFIVRTRLKKKQRMVCMEIKDNGPGIDKKTLLRVFEPFFTTKPVGEGLGLGLSISYFITSEIHGGEMSVESTAGKGATFIIALPLEGKS